MPLILKNNLKFLGAYAFICFVCMLVYMQIDSNIDITNIILAGFVIVLVTSVQLAVCFFCGKYLGVNHGRTILNLSSSLLILIVVVVFVLLSANTYTNFISGMVGFFASPVMLLFPFVAEILNIDSDASLFTCILFPYAAFTVGAATKKEKCLF